MRIIKLTIAYDGTGYNGWQVQRNGRTIQGEIGIASLRAFGKKCRVHGAGRTDAGVHAKRQVAHLKVPEGIPTGKILIALNSSLPEDIVIVSAVEVKEDFHARYSAKRKHYRYSILNTRKSDPFKGRYSWRVPYKLDVPLMKKEAACLVGTHDFKSFQASDKKEVSSVRKIFYIKIQKKGSLITMDIEGNGFLYNMVRNIAGVLMAIGSGEADPEWIEEVLAARDRTKAGKTAPSGGLYLSHVTYDKKFNLPQINSQTIV